MKKILIHARHEDYNNLKLLLEKCYHIDINEKDFVQITLFVPDASVNSTIDALRETLDMRYRDTLIEVSSPDFVISSSLNRAEKSVKTSEKTPVEQLLDSARDYVRIDYWSISLTAIAGLIALIGLFLNNVAIIIGAMLLSPILGPIHSFTIYAALGRANDALRSIRVLAILLGSVFMVSAIATYLLNYLILFIPSTSVSLAITSEIISRTSSSPIYIVMAILLGMASIIALTRGSAEFIAGVAVAAALLPPTVVAGISVVMLPADFVGSALLVMDNVIGLMAGALISTLLLGIAPRNSGETKVAKKFIQRTSVMIFVMIVFLSVMSYIF
ncbi:putative hydrophobic protein (TIGR00341 family) [Methanomicrobium sp. W14]|uniref:TIGR00341 family protein n=1 Tax=Methanomicrobium sp. W14 TaxID=2817839 RepID=UPI001AEA3BB3|nr:TIGR00341 family protein [Methanomicrobium sp. W14]MBP2132787.1 putative hydrophobic protein (TIGR00341 family) [Methanomicrobium sp. W14]